jgi:hypothetical protein
MIVSYSNIETILRIEDVEGLIESGAPDNEYNSEAKCIVDVLKRLQPEDITEENIVTVISTVWEKMFHLDKKDISKRLPAFRNVAKGIFSSAEG